MNYKQRLVELDADLDRKANAYLAQLSKSEQNSGTLAKLRTEWDEAEDAYISLLHLLKIGQVQPTDTWPG